MTTMRDRIKQAIEQPTREPTQRYRDIDGLIAVAYWIGKHDAAVEVCDKHASILKAMRDRADKCRYHYMAHGIIGKRQGTAYDDIIYHPDYSSDFVDYTVEEITA